MKRMLKMTAIGFCCLFISFNTSACTPAKSEETDSTSTHVIILGFDGWGASSFEDAEMPFLKSQLSHSAWTLKKRSILPTSSACNWASMFKGAGPEAHGFIDWNTRVPAFDVTYTDENGNFPSIFSIYRKAHPDDEMAYLYQWDGMKFIVNTKDFNYTKTFNATEEGSVQMMDAAISYIKDKKPQLAAFIWDYPDAIGHTAGWYSEAYMSELKNADSIIEKVVQACDEAGILDNTLIIVTSDHGGHQKTHGKPLMSDLETPFILFGPGIKPQEITYPLMQYDVAAIIADYLYLELPLGWRGITPKGLFE